MQRICPLLLLPERPRYHITGAGMHFMLLALGSGARGETYTQQVTCCMEDMDGGGCGRLV